MSRSQIEDGEIKEDKRSDRESSDDALDIKPPQISVPKMKRSKRDKREKEHSSRNHGKRRHHGNRHSWAERGGREWERHRVHHRHHSVGSSSRHTGGVIGGNMPINPRHREDRFNEDLRKKLQRDRQERMEWDGPSPIKRDRRDPEVEKRRDKLLLAERESAIQKQRSKRELEERRLRHEEERRRHKEKQKRRHADKRRKNEEEEKKKTSQALSQQALDMKMLEVEDISEEEDEEEEEKEEDSQDSEESSSDSDSSANSDSSSSESASDNDKSKNNKRASGSSNDKVENSKKNNNDEDDEDDDDDDDDDEEEEEGEEEEEAEDDDSVRKSKSRTPSVPDDQNVPLQKDEPANEESESEGSPVNELPETQLPPYMPAIMGCRSVEEFNCLNRIEEGTYGVVYRARDKRTNEIVALKRLKMEKEKEGFPITSLREISTLLKAQHDNIVTVREIVVGSNMDKIYIVMDYVEHDLKSLMETMKLKKQMFVFSEVKTLMIQLLAAVAHMHDNWILHRDLKTSNLLLSHKGILKVGDFGLAREYGSPLKAYTPVVVTLWYRAPELLLGQKEYSTHIDMWSVGCIFGELLLMEALFPGKSEADEINRIFKDLGTPNEKIWPGYKELSLVKKVPFADYPYNQLRNRFASQKLTDEGFKLLNRFLTYSPERRITAEAALEHVWLRDEKPAPKDPSMFPTWPAKSELGHRRVQSPKPPSGGVNYKDMDKDEDIIGFHMGADAKINYSGPGFKLKF